ncbi:MAG: glycosyltransferase family 2 protein [Candidatus Omnitrophica bacterium]|nr:glycosyltransferase family 2 protein [Candidatus Omnitrophota bacterium]
MNKYLLGISVYNEGEKLRTVIARFNDYATYDVLIIDDGSTDGSLADLPKNEHLFIVRNAGNCGAGYSVRRALYYGKEQHYDAVILVAGNNKDRPQDVYRLIKAFEEGYDLVQGSRYLPGGDWGNMPAYRVFATSKIHPWLFSFVSGFQITDSTNGFRAVRLSLLDDKRINLNQSWLDQYELEPYLFYKVIKLGYRVKEVPVVKVYPPKEQGYTKMKPITGWWSILRPLIYLPLGIKK